MSDSLKHLELEKYIQRKHFQNLLMRTVKILLPSWCKGTAS